MVGNVRMVMCPGSLETAREIKGHQGDCSTAPVWFAGLRNMANA